MNTNGGKIIRVSEQDFILWLREEIRNRGWKQADFARKASLAPSTVSMVLKMQKSPGMSFCRRTAKALNLPPDEILIKAGYLPNTEREIEEDKTFQQIIEVVRDLSPHQRQDVYEYLLLYRKQQNRKIQAA